MWACGAVMIKYIQNNGYKLMFKDINRSKQKLFFSICCLWRFMCKKYVISLIYTKMWSRISGLYICRLFRAKQGNEETKIVLWEIVRGSVIAFLSLNIKKSWHKICFMLWSYKDVEIGLFLCLKTADKYFMEQNLLPKGMNSE